jgi:hypothetical protein
MIEHLMKRTTAILALATAAGCASGSLLGEPLYEERTRIFFAYENQLRASLADPPDQIARRFAPTAAVNSAFEDLGSKGFTLHALEPLPDGVGATLFRFRRPLPKGKPRPTMAPMEFTGLYGAQSGDLWTYYFFEPTYKGYRIHTLSPGGRATADTTWMPEQDVLQWQQDELEGQAELERDGRSILITLTTVVQGAEAPISRQFEIRRLLTLNN